MKRPPWLDIHDYARFICLCENKGSASLSWPNASSKHLVAVILLSGHLQDSGFAKERNGKIIFQRNSGSWANVPSRFWRFWVLLRLLSSESEKEHSRTQNIAVLHRVNTGEDLEMSTLNWLIEAWRRQWPMLSDTEAPGRSWMNQDTAMDRNPSRG